MGRVTPLPKALPFGAFDGAILAPSALELPPSPPLTAFLTNRTLWPGLLGDVEDIELRIEKYGVNVIPQKPPPSFLQLAWEAIQDPLLIVLCCAAALTIGLSFYHPPPEDIQGIG